MSASGPTLGDLRAELLDGIPSAGVELMFYFWGDLGPEDEDYYAPGRLPDCILVKQEAMQRVLRGDFDHLPNSTPLVEFL
jgi:hypothetical protein